MRTVAMRGIFSFLAHAPEDFLFLEDNFFNGRKSSAFVGAVTKWLGG